VCRGRASSGSQASKSGVTADTALRLSRALGTTPELWMNLQNGFCVKTTMLHISKELDQIEPVNKAA
jgi:antitoxin HigA-1